MLTSDAIAIRCLCFRVLHLRGQAESGVTLKGQADRFRAFADDLRRWAEKVGVVEALSESERELYDKPLGEWEHEDTFGASMRGESLKALLWSIEHLPKMPSWFDPADGGDIFSMVPVISSVDDFIEQSHLRPIDEIQAERRKAKLLDQRARMEVIRWEDGKASSERDEAAVRDSLEGVDFELDYDREDVLVDGTRFRDLEVDARLRIAAICRERCRALEWVCSHNEDWNPQESAKHENTT